MPSDNDRKITLEEIKDFLGVPPLIQGESQEDFWKWVSVFADEYQPVSFSDWLEIHDYAVKYWEKDRIRRSNAALVEGMLYQALKNLVSQFSEDSYANAVTVSDYYFGDAKEKEQATKKLMKYGITDGQITAEAMKIRAKELVAFDRMDNYRTNSTRVLRQGLERRSEARLKQSDQLSSEQRPGATGDQQSELKPPNLN